MRPIPGLETVSEAAKRAGVHPSTIIRWARAVEKKTGRRVLRRPAWLKRWFYLDSRSLASEFEDEKMPQDEA